MIEHPWPPEWRPYPFDGVRWEFSLPDVKVQVLGISLDLPRRFAYYRISVFYPHQDYGHDYRKCDSLLELRAAIAALCAGINSTKGPNND
jgi:hypothetical protein